MCVGSGAGAAGEERYERGGWRCNESTHGTCL